MSHQKKHIIAAYAYDQPTLTISQEDARKLTHINIAFGKFDQGSVLVDGLELISKADQLRAWNPGLKILLSMVGAGPDDFSVVCATEAGRRKMAASCAETVSQYNLDGIDLDWEYPCCPSNNIASSPEDKITFTLLCEEIRKALDQIDGRYRLLTIAAGADQHFVDGTEMDKVQRYLDYVFLMTYDLRCGFHSLTGHHTNLYTATGDIFRTSLEAAVNIFLNAGVPRSKLVPGAAFYSRRWEGVRNRNKGFLQVATTRGVHGPPYHDLLEHYIGKNGFTRYWDDECKSPWLFDGSSYISYEDEKSIGYKCRFVRQEQLPGLFYWQHGSDRTGTLLQALYKGLEEHEHE